MMRLVATACLVLLAGGVQAAEKTVIAVSGPLASLAQALAGEVAEVVYPVPEGTDPMLWRPGVAEIGQIQAADVILLNGAGFARWTAKTSLPRARVVDTSKAFADAYIATTEGVTHSHGAEGAHSHSGTVPQTWMDFAQAEAQMRAIAERLARALPDEAGEIGARAEALSQALLALDARAEALGARLAGRTVVADHPGLDYFARAYGLSVVTLDWPPGVDPDAAQVEALTALVGEASPALFRWQATPTPAARAEVEAAGLPQAVLDPRTDDTDDFTAAMTANLDALEAAL